tara:strand:- start:1569 stop:1799 length:231 start_codon:yes stop_codon:yes gene_type:complete
MPKKFKVGDLVKLNDPSDKDRDIGIVVDLSPRQVHLISHGSTNVVQVYWPKINDSDWEYDFFLVKFDDPDLTKRKK